MKSKKILVIDDEPSIREIVGSYLKHAGYLVYEAGDGKTGLELFMGIQPDFVILDLMLPDRSGESVCEVIRRRSQVPILMLTAKVEESQRIQGFTLGADDYLTKPFSPRELLLRVQSILKRTGGSSEKNQESPTTEEGDFHINWTTLVATKLGIPLGLTPTEFRLLKVFLEHPGQVFSRIQLAEAALGEDFDGFDRTVDAHIKNLRIKIETDPRHPVFIETVFGFGYRWKESPL